MNLLTREFKIIGINVSLAAILWFVLAMAGAISKILLGHGNIGNYLIFENTFLNAVHQTNLYFVDPVKNLGSYLYGPLFSVIIAPFAILPTNIGAFFWELFNAAFLFLAIRKLPVSYRNQNIILFFSAIEMMTCVQNMQINCLIAGLIIFSFIYVQRQQNLLAPLFIVVGFLTKIYGIVGLAFFFFSNQKMKFTLSFFFWLVVLICLPMLISSPSFIIGSYVDWYHTLVVKDMVNAHSEYQNLSVMGLFRNIFKTEHLDMILLVSGAIFYALPFLRWNQFRSLNFWLTYLSFALIGVVIFSSSAESPTYIIAVSGVGIWYVLQDASKKSFTFLLLFTLVLTSLSSTDLFPSYLKDHLVRPYSLKALPCFLVWLTIAYQLLKHDFLVEPSVQNKLVPDN